MHHKCLPGLIPHYAIKYLLHTTAQIVHIKLTFITSYCSLFQFPPSTKQTKIIKPSTDSKRGSCCVTNPT